MELFALNLLPNNFHQMYFGFQKEFFILHYLTGLNKMYLYSQIKYYNNIL